MIIQRRKFLNKSLIGFLSLSLFPTSFALLKRDEHSLSVNDLFARLSFKPGTSPLGGLDENFKPSVGEFEQISRIGNVLYSRGSVCIPEINHFIPGANENIASIYGSTLSGYSRVISLNQLELTAIKKMIASLETDHNISNPEKLKGLLIPILKTSNHTAPNHVINGECSCHLGYYTARGYCSIRSIAKGNNIRIQTRLLDFNKIESYQSSYLVQNLA